MKDAHRISLAVALASWPARRWLAAVGGALITYLVVAVPTDLIDTPLFTREVPPTWWSFPVLAVTAGLTGMVAATYVSREPTPQNYRHGRFGAVGAAISFFAVGCPVCNKIVLLALGASGAMRYFEPIQPLLAAGSVALLMWALHQRATSEDRCRAPQVPAAARSANG
ncbi:hypothetical protein SAMN04488693_107187 [Arthrobacter subterraneus]|uniref:Uncharacterized protein n=1 Tax=Arthrobacter subterraneus TaxID=335973 RepID=A0A1G8IX72_9MICC|nr:hypothetical protein [Arthrobacter subterraneus]SDI23402.1 hypothetical protein SAMN04488693_107187 [Arthrobacter subterraneus]